MRARLARSFFPEVWRWSWKVPLRLVPAMCTKPRNVNVSGLGSPFRSRSFRAYLPSSRTRVFVRVKLQGELRHALGQGQTHRSRVLFELESHHEVIGVAHDIHVSARLLLPPGLDPQVEHVVQVDVREQGADDAALRRACGHFVELAILHDACLHPLHQKTNEASIPDPMLDELLHPAMGDGVERTPGCLRRAHS